MRLLKLQIILQPKACMQVLDNLLKRWTDKKN